VGGAGPQAPSAGGASVNGGHRGERGVPRRSCGAGWGPT
jgi:hypothetical protein